MILKSCNYDWAGLLPVIITEVHFVTDPPQFIPLPWCPSKWQDFDWWWSTMEEDKAAPEGGEFKQNDINEKLEVVGESLEVRDISFWSRYCLYLWFTANNLWTNWKEGNRGKSKTAVNLISELEVNFRGRKSRLSTTKITTRRTRKKRRLTVSLTAHVQRVCDHIEGKLNSCLNLRHKKEESP